MADSSALTLVSTKTLLGLGVQIKEYTGTADDQAAKAHSGPGTPFFYTISDDLDTEVACAITAVDGTNITYGAASSTTARVFLWFQDSADQDGTSISTDTDD